MAPTKPDTRPSFWNLADLRSATLPLLLMIWSMGSMPLLLEAVEHRRGNLLAAFQALMTNPHVRARQFTVEIWAVGAIAAFGLSQVIGMIIFDRLARCKPYFGPALPDGSNKRARHPKLGPFQSCFTWAVVVAGYFCYMANVEPGDVLFVDVYPDLIRASTVIGFSVALFLYARACIWPTCPVAKAPKLTLGGIIEQFYSGLELYPSFDGRNLQIKNWTNCRWGMTLWLIFASLFALDNFKRNDGMTWGMLAHTTVMHAYLFKFFWWEHGYYHTLDIMHDRVGYYLAYGCISFLPLVYLTPSYAMASKLGETSTPFVAYLSIVCGIASMVINYGIDLQKTQFKNDGTISWLGFGRRPASFISDGKRRLLVDGFWTARKINYTFELLLTFFWTLPAGITSWVPWYYLMYLTVLLTHRIYRDEARCASKYGELWTRYKERVPGVLIPTQFTMTTLAPKIAHTVHHGAQEVVQKVEEKTHKASGRAHRLFSSDEFTGQPGPNDQVLSRTRNVSHYPDGDWQITERVIYRLQSAS
ncbi:uncharacterized protein MONBRDRAFT_26465 [Monosiga brevicollis MX1]|uniref:7-dehydrocholesterol reductase n=1 Tax=Monosiga brevicollis TaxID=81824 RepID=A9V2F9_MONBE|nr:uncharacterized protein MONBRDRAFT_26465 [Monosiga brevicollis MX1]EDQ88368.1 predicted protein [Monosiga brevicollis MX1]|eukprot:XP_001746961.1 hypothetical protein [Monosiga brevicollis MX1]